MPVCYYVVYYILQGFYFNRSKKLSWFQVMSLASTLNQSLYIFTSTKSRSMVILLGKDHIFRSKRYGRMETIYRDKRTVIEEQGERETQREKEQARWER